MRACSSVWLYEAWLKALRVVGSAKHFRQPAENFVEEHQTGVRTRASSFLRSLKCQTALLAFHPFGCNSFLLQLSLEVFRIEVFMKCERCQQNSARVRVDQMINGKRESHYLCQSCVDEIMNSMSQM